MQKGQWPRKFDNKLDLCTIVPILLHSIQAYQVTVLAAGSKGHGDVFALTECVRALKAMSLTLDTASAVITVGIQALHDCLKVYGEVSVLIANFFSLFLLFDLGVHAAPGFGQR